MQIKQLSDVTLKFDYQGEKFIIENLEACHLEVKNDFSRINSVSSGNWRGNSEVTALHTLRCKLKGMFSASSSDIKLLSLAMQNSKVDAEIKLDSNFSINGKMVIEELDIRQDYDDFLIFEVTLINSGVIESVIN
jgi:predicted secreted protein